MTLRETLDEAVHRLAEPVHAAQAVGLRYGSDSEPGIRRVRRGRAFQYFDPQGHAIRDSATLARIRALAIPPAWKDIWICPAENGHLQATGRDARGRKQYRYHRRWREIRDETKYARILTFAEALPKIRSRVRTDLDRSGLPRERVLAAVVRLLETSSIRVGNDEYARANRSYGLTTLRDRHVEISGPQLRFEFRGKSGRAHRIELTEPRLAKIVKRCQELPGQELFQYLDSEGQTQRIDSGDVNEYLRELAGADFTAKDFRTWNGTVEAAVLLRDCPKCRKKTEIKRTLTTVVEKVAGKLGNTAAVCRKCYIHPVLLEAFTEGTFEWPRIKPKASRDGLSADEAAALHFLRRRLTQVASGSHLRGRLAASLKRVASLRP